MANNRPIMISIGLIAALIVVPVVIMALMGFDNYDANEFLIISVAVIADILVYLAYRLLLLPRLSS